MSNVVYIKNYCRFAADLRRKGWSEWKIKLARKVYPELFKETLESAEKRRKEVLDYE